MNENIIPHNHKVKKEDRVRLLGQNPVVLWFTGLSGSGKSTLAGALETELYNRGFNTYLLDGDNVRSGLNSDLDFSSEGRVENIRRLGELSKLFVDSGMIVLTAFISPFRSDRASVRGILQEGEFVEIFVDTPIEICEQRDVKGLYKKARAGEIKNFTGIDSPFEVPENAEVRITTHDRSVESAVSELLTLILPKISRNE
jgi:adenylyl-sulfate kinase